MSKYKNIILLVLLILSIPSVLSATLNGSSSIFVFNVTNCQADFISVGCSPETIRFDCDITNSAFIDFTEFEIDGTLFNATRIGQNWYYDFSKPNQTSTINTTINFTRIFITDTNSDTAVFLENVSVNHDCVTCTDVGFTDPCSVFDNTTQHQIYAPSGCQNDTNVTIACNYCSEDLNQVLGDCKPNNLQNITYFDANFFSCCSATGLSSDCSILTYPFNSTTTQACAFLQQDFNCDFPAFTEINEEMPFSCLMNDSEVYTCVVNVFENDRLLQVNPEFKTAIPSLISLSSTRLEPKEFFIPQNRLLNAYFTDKNILTNQEFKVQVVCSSATKTIKSEYLVEPFYKDLSFILNRTVWVGNNASKLLWFGLIIVITIIIMIVLIKGLRRRGTSR